MSKATFTTEKDVFTAKLAEYKRLIDEDIASYSKQLERETLQQFGANARLEIDAYLSILKRGGKRIRGALVMAAYEMCGGTDKKVAIQAARAIEMLHAYILIIDDFQDRSSMRRGGPTAHKLLAAHHEQEELAGNSEHFGISIALNAALSGAHAAQEIVTQLNVPADRKLRALELMNHTMRVTAHGQTNDIVNEVVADVSAADIERVLTWKTAQYTFLNPLSIGMILAGADEQSIAAISDYAIPSGKAFQITDDILGTFGTEFASGKSPMDDIREGKRTLITEYALTHTNDDNKNFLIQMLGNTNLTPAEFERCKDILVESGALEFAQNKAKNHVEAAVQSLQQLAGLDKTSVAFLTGLAQSLLGRTV